MTQYICKVQQTYAIIIPGSDIEDVRPNDGVFLDGESVRQTHTLGCVGVTLN